MLYAPPIKAASLRSTLALLCLPAAAEEVAVHQQTLLGTTIHVLVAVEVAVGPLCDQSHSR